MWFFNYFIFHYIPCFLSPGVGSNPPKKDKELMCLYIFYAPFSVYL